MTGDPTFVLLHSPLVGPYSWEPVREELNLRGYVAVAPEIASEEPPYWRAYVDHAVEAITDLGADEVVLVAHSGAGPLSAAIADMCVPEIASVVLVDAGMPHDGWSYLQEMDVTSPGLAEGIRTDLGAGATYPDWDESFLGVLVPDPDQRRQLLAEVHPRPLAFFEESIPAPTWPRDRCAYIQLSESYTAAADEAERLGWPLERRPLGHFAPVTHPDVVTSGILVLVEAVSD